MEALFQMLSPREVAGRRGKRTSLKASYRYNWYDLDFRTFHSLGVIARRAPDNSPRFNFPQTVWLYPDVNMDWSARNTRAAQTLAVNILTSMVNDRDFITHFGATSRRVIEVADLFTRDCLLTMPTDGGCLPRDMLEQWIKAKL